MRGEGMWACGRVVGVGVGVGVDDYYYYHYYYYYLFLTNLTRLLTRDALIAGVPR
jgi:hypothetical protein